MSNEPAPLHITEPDHPNVGMIVAFVLAMCVLIVVVIVGVMQYFDFNLRAELQLKQYGAESTALRKLRADEKTKLSMYSWVSQRDGTVRLPLDRAIELTLRDWNSRPGGVVAFQAAGAAPAAPAPTAPVPTAPAPTAPVPTAPAPTAPAPTAPTPTPAPTPAPGH